jgi:hypothetical protein
MIRKRLIWSLGLLFIVIIIVFVASRGVNSPAVPAPLVNFFDESPTGFSFQYPDGWRYIIPRLNLLLLAEDVVFVGEPGPAFTVQRSARLAESTSLKDALDTYLRQGPLRPDREWEISEDVTTITFAGRDALTVILEGIEDPNPNLQRTRILATTAANGMVYIFNLTAPAADWLTYAPTLEAILASVDILE